MFSYYWGIYMYITCISIQQRDSTFTDHMFLANAISVLPAPMSRFLTNVLGCYKS